MLLNLLHFLRDYNAIFKDNSTNPITTNKLVKQTRREVATATIKISYLEKVPSPIVKKIPFGRRIENP